MNMIKKISFVLFVFLTPILCHGQTEKNSTAGIHWMSFSEALEKTKDHPKKIYMDIYTSWCGWCKKMDASTFVDPKIISFINENFYAVKLDAETKDTITFQNKKYSFVPNYKANEIAAFLLNGQMGYPTSVYFDEASNPITAVPGFNTADQLLPILKYFSGDFYKTMKFEDFQKAGKN